MPDSTQPRPDAATIRGQFQAWNSGDYEGWMGEAHPEIEYTPGIIVGPAGGERVVYRGHDELRRFFEEWHSQWRMEFTVGEIEPAGDWILILGRARLTGVQSGATVEQDVGLIAQYEDGLLRRFRSCPSHQAARDAVEAS